LLTGAGGGSAAGSGAVAFSNFLDLLSAAGISRPKRDVLTDLQLHHHHVILSTGTPEAARGWYEHVRDLPKSPTRGRFKSATGYTLNGDWQYAFNLSLAYGPVGEALIFKRMRGLRDAEVTAALAISVDAPPGIVRCEYRNVEDDEHREFGGLLMRKFERALSTAPGILLSHDVLFARATAMVAAVRHIHARGYVHMDIKEANVFIDLRGEWALGDFGSAVLVNTPIASTTRGLHPALSACHEGLELPALPKYDIYMLAALLVRQLDANSVRTPHPDEGPRGCDLRARAAAVTDDGLRHLLLELLAEVGE